MRLSFRKALLIYTLIPIISIFIAFTIENLVTIKNDTQQLIEQHMIDLSVSYANIFDGFLRPIEGAAKTNADLVEIHQDVTEEDIYQLLELQVEHNPIIYGAAVAFTPRQFDENRRLVAPYVYRKNGKLKRMDIGESGYDYTDSEWEWWNDTIATGQARWTEPYFDEGAGNILMSTYSVPFYRDGNLWGVATVDISLHEISDKIQIPGVNGQDITVLSSSGLIILSPNREVIGKSIFDVVRQGFHKALEFHGKKDRKTIEANEGRMLDSINAMLAGETGMADLTSLQNMENFWYFFAPIKSAKWSFSIQVKESEVFESVYHRAWYSLAFFGLLLILIILAIVLVSGKFSSALKWLIDRCQRIQRLNFQTVEAHRFNIVEIREMSNTLNSMARALGSHFSIQEDTRIARSIRQQALPSYIPNVQGFQVEIWSHCANDRCGEIYDVVEGNAVVSSKKNKHHRRANAVGFMLLDSADSGIDASVKNIQLRTIFRTAARQGEGIESIARRMNQYLCMDTSLNGPVQAWFGMLDSQKGRLVSLSLGYIEVFHFISEKSRLQRLHESAPSLSLQDELPELMPNTLELADGDVIVVASDGVTAALNQQREKFGVEPIERQLKIHKQASAGEMLQAIREELLEFSRNAYVQADCSIIVIKRGSDSEHLPDSG